MDNLTHPYPATCYVCGEEIGESAAAEIVYTDGSQLASFPADQHFLVHADTCYDARRMETA